MKESKDVKPVSFRLSVEAYRLLSLIANKHGVSRTAALEFMIRDAAEKKGIE
jgi:predicted DNA-binding protein